MKEKSGNGFNGIIGNSSAMIAVYEQIRKAAETEIPVMVLGETGTGKDLVAQTIHSLSKRRSKPFLPVSLGAIPRDLVGSELFGHEKGSFTGATEMRQGVFEQGNDGTVFLDDIDAIDEKTQVSLLRLIETQTFSRLGGNQQQSTNARLIVASNADLKESIHSGQFRKDLFYRLDVFRIRLPLLMERNGDIELLTEAFIKRYNKSFGKAILGIKKECSAAMQSYQWPGNVRELKNVIQRAMLICEDDKIRLDHLPARFRSTSVKRNSKVTFKVGTPLENIMKEMILHALAEASNNRTFAAKLLGISRRSLYDKIRRYQIQNEISSYGVN